MSTMSTVSLGLRKAINLRVGNLVLIRGTFGESIFRVAEVRPLANRHQVAVSLEQAGDRRPRQYVYDVGDLFDVVAERS
jgi:hypothetical protein